MSEVLADGGFLKFTSLSRVGASTRIEALRALYIVTAETFENAFLKEGPENRQILEEFVRAASGTGMWVVTRLLPGIELDAFARLPDPYDPPVDLGSLSHSELDNHIKHARQHAQERQRLELLAMSDTACTQSETTESFVSFLRTLDPKGREYWPQVYQRIGLTCPLAYGVQGSVPTPEPKTGWLRKAAEQGLAGAQWLLGYRYVHGDGAERNVAEAAKWLRKAAEQGHAAAQRYLAACYANGHGVTQDDKEAMKWYRQAAEHGDPEAQCTLGLCYAMGNHLDEDAIEGYQWVRRAADQGYEDASVALALVEGLLSPEQFLEAERRYREAR